MKENCACLLERNCQHLSPFLSFFVKEKKSVSRNIGNFLLPPIINNTRGELILIIVFIKSFILQKKISPVFFLILFPKRKLFPVYVFLQRFLFSSYYFSFVPMCNLWPCKCMGAVWFKRHWKVFPWSNRNWSLPSSREMCFDALKIKMEIMLSKNVLKLWNLPVFSSSLNHLEARYVYSIDEILQLYTTCSKIIKRI